MISRTVATLIVTWCIGKVQADAPNALEFTDILPENAKTYDKMRPPKKEGAPAVVFFHVTVMGLDTIDETSMTYVADIFFAQTWKDHRLRLPENMTAEYRLLDVAWLKHFWRPDSFFKNAKSVTFQTMTIPNHYLWLYKDKTILYMVKLTLKLSCVMNFLIYPHDTQECKLQMESLSHTTEEMLFQWDPDVPLVVDENIQLPQLALIENRTADCTQIYSTGNFSCVEVIFKLKRRLVYFMFNTYIPTCLIVIMSWVSFWIKPEVAPARVALGVTSLLTLFTQIAKSQSSLPPVSYLKAVDAFMSACTIFVFMALMEYCLINIILGENMPKPAKPPQPPAPAEKEKEKIFEFINKNGGSGKRESRVIPNAIQSPHPAFLRNSSLHSVQTEKTILITQGTVSSEPSIPPPPKPAVLPKLTPVQERMVCAIKVDRASRILFPASFTALNIIYWIIFWKYV